MKEIKKEDEYDYYYETIEDGNQDEDDFEAQGQDENGKTKSTRHEFKKNTRIELMIRAGLRCSNPFCRKMTIAFDSKLNKTISIGEAAHIVAAKIGGPRNNGNALYTEEYIKNINNGIWLCACCHSLIDKPGNDKQYTVSLLQDWKNKAESIYIEQISKPRLEFMNSIKEDIVSNVDFKFEEASGLQIAIISYLVFNDTSFSFYRKNQYHNDDMDPSDYFYDAYEEFFNWISATNNRKVYAILNMKLPSPTQWWMEKHMELKQLFEDALLSSNLSKVVNVTEKEIRIDSYSVCDKIFHNDYDAVEKYIDKMKQ